ncbi:ATP-binding protein [Streptomyces sp. SS]|uniref:ATP-binding protein n=1 Tax=Streptomyces sp. SS TaxID=260742 RepID=UPI0003018D40|nr:ATP-binding protein [Streptomyces sp. SS]
MNAIAIAATATATAPKALAPPGDHGAGTAIAARREPRSADEMPGRRSARTPGRADYAWELAHQPESAGTARRVTRAVLIEWGRDEDTIDQALLVVSELVANAVEHALPPIALHLDRTEPGDTLRIEVDDGGPAAQEGTWTASCAADEHGRGLGIVALLATAHGCREGDDGATYWALL